jgi:dipeptidyl aminopeptidase/acylaminoacyl peptidase
LARPHLAQVPRPPSRSVDRDPTWSPKSNEWDFLPKRDARPRARLVSGDDDRNVDSPDHRPCLRLCNRGVEVEELVLANEMHSFLRYASWLEAFTAAADSFDRWLKRVSRVAQ